MAHTIRRTCGDCGWEGEAPQAAARREEVVKKGAITEVALLAAVAACSGIIYAILTGDGSGEERQKQVISAGVFGVVWLYAAVNAFYKVPRRIRYAGLEAPCWRCPGCGAVHWLRVLKRL